MWSDLEAIFLHRPILGLVFAYYNNSRQIMEIVTSPGRWGLGGVKYGGRERRLGKERKKATYLRGDRITEKN